jgi:hypothetical protein
MAITVLKRKKLKNRLKTKKRQTIMKQQSARPAIKKVDIEEIKATFTQQEAPTKKKAAKKEEAAADTDKE